MPDAAPPIEVVIVQKQTVDVRADAIERLARLLAKADGRDPDADSRISTNGNFATMLTVNLPYPMNMGWYAYREKAEAMLKEAFAK